MTRSVSVLRPGHRTRLLAGGAACTLLLGGCSFGSGLYNVNLPGGADTGDHPYSVTVEFRDALDLVPQSAVKVNDVAVGRVTKISLEKSNGKIADVTVEVNGAVTLPANAVASIQQTSLLGEKYVALAAPLNKAGTGTLRNHDRIDVLRTSDGVEVEQVFGALSLLLNGGGIGQLHDIYTELNAFQGDHTTEIRRFLNSVTSVVTTVNTHRADITAALDSINTLATSLRGRNTQIAGLLKTFAPGIAELANQRKQIIGALTALNNLGTVTVKTLDRSTDDIVADLKQLAPILSNLAKSGSALPQSLQVLLTYPFSNGAVGGVKGDYLNAFVVEQLNTAKGSLISPASATSWPTTSSASPNVRTGDATPATITPPAGMLPATSSAAPGLPSTLTLTPSGASSSGGR